MPEQAHPHVTEKMPFPSAKKSDRVLERAKLDAKVYLHDEDQLFISTLHNISASGIFLNNITSLAVGQIVRLVIKSEILGTPVPAVGEVVRVENKERKGTAVVFTHIEEKSQKEIHQGVFSSLQGTPF